MIGLSTTSLGGGDVEEWLASAVEMGFDYIEWVSEWPRFLNGSTTRRLEELLQSYDLKLTIHAPFSDINIASFNEKIRSASLEVIESTLLTAAELGAMAITIHPGHCSPVSRRYQAEYIEIHRNSLARIAQTAEDAGVRVGVENMPSFPILDAQTPERLHLLLEGIDIGVTFDVGHLNTTTADFSGFLRLFRDRIVLLHLHDNHGDRDEHLAVGDGTVPWEKVLRGAPPVPATLEVTDLESARRSLAFLKRLHW